MARYFRLLVINDNSLGGGTGKSLTALNVYAPADRQAYTYWVALALMAVLIIAGFVLLRSRLGTSLQAIRDDERAAESVGVRVTHAKRIVFLFAAITVLASWIPARRAAGLDPTRALREE